MQFIFPFELKLLGVKKVYSPLNFSSIIAKFLNIKTILCIHSNLAWVYFSLMPNNILRNPNGLSHAEFRFLCCIYSMTVGYQRNTCKLKNVQISEMTSLANSKIKKYRDKLVNGGFIQCKKQKGTYNYKINTTPISYV